MLFAQSVLKDEFHGTTLLLAHCDPEADLSLYLDIATVIWLLDKGFDTVAFRAGPDDGITHVNLQELLLTLAFGFAAPIMHVETRLDALEKFLDKPLGELTAEDLANIPQTQIDSLTQAFIAVYGPMTAFDGHPVLADSNVTPEFWLALLSRQMPKVFQSFLSTEGSEQALLALAYWEALSYALDSEAYDAEALAEAYPGVDLSTRTSKWGIFARMLMEKARSEYTTTDRHAFQTDRSVHSFLIPAGATWFSTANILTSEGLSGTAADIARAARAAAFGGTLDDQEEQRYGFTLDSETGRPSMVVYPGGHTGTSYLVASDPDTGELTFVDTFTGQRVTPESADYDGLQAFYDSLFVEESPGFNLTRKGCIPQTNNGIPKDEAVGQMPARNSGFYRGSGFPYLKEEEIRFFLPAYLYCSFIWNTHCVMGMACTSLAMDWLGKITARY